MVSGYVSPFFLHYVRLQVILFCVWYCIYLEHTCYSNTQLAISVVKLTFVNPSYCQGTNDTATSICFNRFSWYWIQKLVRECLSSAKRYATPPCDFWRMQLVSSSFRSWSLTVLTVYLAYFEKKNTSYWRVTYIHKQPYQKVSNRLPNDTAESSR